MCIEDIVDSFAAAVDNIEVNIVAVEVMLLAFTGKYIILFDKLDLSSHTQLLIILVGVRYYLYPHLRNLCPHQVFLVGHN